MSALSREEHTEACRALFSLAGENLILPPLIRDAGDALATSGYTYYCAAGQRCVRVDVEFDQAYVNENKFPLQRLPLQISCFLCDQDYQILPAQFDESERFALIGSFFLGAQAPIAVEVNEAERNFKLSVQLSPTFFAEWREPIQDGETTTAESLCRRVGLCLYEKSREFFGSRETGVAVWSLRAAQELLGAPKLTPDALWPFISFGSAATPEAPSAATPDAPVAPASISVPVPASATLPVLRETKPQLSSKATGDSAPVAAEGRAPAPVASETSREWRRPGGLAAAAALAASLYALFQPAALPRWATTRDAEAQATATAVTSGAQTAIETRAAGPAPQTNLLAALPESPEPSPAVGPTGPPAAGAGAIDQSSSVAWPLSAETPKAKSGLHGKPAAAKKPPGAAAKSGVANAGDAGATARPASSHVTRKARGGGPMQSVGRAVDHMANSLIKGLQAIPAKIVKIAE